MIQRRWSEGIHEAVEVVQKLCRRKLRARQELSWEGRRRAEHKLGTRHGRLLQRYAPEAEEDPR